MPASPVVHFEIGCRDISKAQAFYGPLLGWEFASYGPTAAMITSPQPGQSSIGGHLNSLGHEPHNYCVVYALVDDLQAKIDQAKKLGGSLVIPPQEVPGMGHFAWIKDPEGNTVGLWKAAMPQK
jgi:predicted enzyme related to lactoylglutathione lyase